MVREQRVSLALALILFSFTLVWVLIFPLSRYLLGTGLGGLELAFWRALLAGGAFCLQAGASGRPKDWGFAALGLFIGLFYASSGLLEAPTPTFVWLYLGAGLALGLLWLFADQSLRKLNLSLASALALYAVATAGGLTPDAFVSQSAWGLMIGLSLTAYVVLSRYLLRRYAPISLYALALPVGALALLPLLGAAPKGAPVWLGLLALALLSSYGLYALYALTLTFLGVSKNTIIATAEPVAASLTVVPFLALPWLGLLAAGFVLLAATAFPLVTPQQRSAKRQRLRARAQGVAHRLQSQL